MLKEFGCIRIICSISLIILEMNRSLLNHVFVSPRTFNQIKSLEYNLYIRGILHLRIMFNPDKEVKLRDQLLEFNTITDGHYLDAPIRQFSRLLSLILFHEVLSSSEISIKRQKMCPVVWSV